MKKKMFSIICSVVLAIACVLLVGCSKDKSGDLSNSPYVGTWKATSASFMGEEAPLEEAVGGDFVMELKGDGTAVVTMAAEVTDCVWNETTKGIKVQGGDINMDLEDKDGTLDVSVIGFHFYFEKQ